MAEAAVEVEAAVQHLVPQPLGLQPQQLQAAPPPPPSKPLTRHSSAASASLVRLLNAMKRELAFSSAISFTCSRMMAGRRRRCMFFLRG